MTSFKFIHAADLHLDSPLLGLAKKSEEVASKVEDASRNAFVSMIQLAIAEECQFIVIPGDLFDGQWRNFQTGLFFAEQMRKLKEVDIKVFIIQGNHDAENRLISRLEFSDNVKIFTSTTAQTIFIEELAVAVHGQSFAKRDVTDNLASNYPAPISSYFNIGLLHTALNGHEGKHAKYAPCSVEQLCNHGYDYWALGHVHDFEIYPSGRGQFDSAIVYSGVLQGRSIRETGPKGVVLVTIEHDRIANIEFHRLDAVRWIVIEVDIESCVTSDDIVMLTRDKIEAEWVSGEGVALAIRILISGRTKLHGDLIGTSANIKEQIETAAATISPEIWIEKLALQTQVNVIAEGIDPSIAGTVRKHIEE